MLLDSSGNELVQVTFLNTVLYVGAECSWQCYNISVCITRFLKTAVVISAQQHVSCTLVCRLQRRFYRPAASGMFLVDERSRGPMAALSAGALARISRFGNWNLRAIIIGLRYLIIASHRAPPPPPEISTARVCHRSRLAVSTRPSICLTVCGMF